MLAVVRITKALADESRVRILRLILERELCVCQIIATVRLAPSTVSRHLLLLKHAGLVESTKRGRWIHYRAAAAPRASAVAVALTFVRTGLSREPRIAEDLKELRRVLRRYPDEFCSARPKR